MKLYISTLWTINYQKRRKNSFKEIFVQNTFLKHKIIFIRKQESTESTQCDLSDRTFKVTSLKFEKTDSGNENGTFWCSGGECPHLIPGQSLNSSLALYFPIFHKYNLRRGKNENMLKIQPDFCSKVSERVHLCLQNLVIAVKSIFFSVYNFRRAYSYVERENRRWSGRVCTAHARRAKAS